MRKLKNGKAVDKIGVTGKIIKGRSDIGNTELLD